MIRDEIARAVQIANECWLRGQKVDVAIVSPLTTTTLATYIVVLIDYGSAATSN